MESSSPKLNADGSWQEKESGVIDFQEDEDPEFIYTTVEGCLTEVSFTVEQDQNAERINNRENEMILVSLAFAGAQKEVGLFSEVPRKVVDQIEGHSLEGFLFTKAGLTFYGHTEQEGYEEVPPNRMVLKDGATKAYFRQKFLLKTEEI